MGHRLMNDHHRCTAKSKTTGNRCKLRAVEGTTVCRMHGGAGVRFGSDNPAFKHGRYSKHAPAHIQDKIALYQQGDQLAIEDELATQRALFAAYLEKFRPGIPLTLTDIDTMMGWLTEITRTVERIVKMRNDTALTASEVGYLQARIVDVVMKYVDDPARQEQFIRDLFGSIGSDRTASPALIEGAASTSQRGGE